MNYSGGGDPFAFLSPPASGKDESKRQRDYLRLTQTLNRRHLESRRELEELDTRIQNFELAARMQVEAMKSIDVSGESETTKRLYGIDGDDKETNDFGMRCLLARRLVESGVRYVHLMHHDWDHHSNLSIGLPKSCRQVDQPIAALLQRSETARVIGVNARRLDRRVRSPADSRGHRWSRSQPARLQFLDGGRRNQTGDHVRSDR